MKLQDILLYVYMIECLLINLLLAPQIMLQQFDIN
jgi:hypothetical protein